MLEPWGVYGTQKKPQICLRHPTEPKTSKTEDFFDGRGGLKKVFLFCWLQINIFFILLEIMRKNIRDTPIWRRSGALSCLERANSITNYRVGSFLIIAGSALFHSFGMFLILAGMAVLVDVIRTRTDDGLVQRPPYCFQECYI